MAWWSRKDEICKKYKTGKVVCEKDVDPEGRKISKLTSYIRKDKRLEEAWATKKGKTVASCMHVIGGQVLCQDLTGARGRGISGLSGWQRKQHKKKRRAKRGGSQCRRLDGRFKRC